MGRVRLTPEQIIGKLGKVGVQEIWLEPLPPSISVGRLSAFASCQ